MNSEKPSRKKSPHKTVQFQILILVIFSIWICLADLTAHFIDGSYFRLGLTYILNTCLLLVPLVFFHRNIRLYGWLLLPFAIIMPISFFCVMLYHMPLNYDMMVVVYNTNLGEAYEFGKGYIIYFVLIMALYLVLYTVLIKKLPRQISFRSSLLLSVAAVIFICLLSFSYNTSTSFKAQLKENVSSTYFGGLIYSAKTLNKSIRTARQHNNIIKNFSFHARPQVNVAGKQVYVLVIGESSRARSWQILGYKRPTSPNLAKKGDAIIKFKNVCSGGYITNLAVPLIFTRATADNYDLHYRERSIVSAFREAGFKTYWLSNQSNFQDVALLADEADEKTYLPSDYTFGKNVHMDMKLLPIFKEVLARNEDKVFIVLHTLGSHYRYSARYPDEYDVFKPSTKGYDVNPRNYQEQQYIINSYDNTIRYTDALLSKVIDMVQQTNATSAVSYISDHGEDMFDDERKLSQHIHAVPSKYIAHVPLFIWLSPKYRSAFPKKVTNLESHADSAIGSQNMFYSLMDVGNVTFPQMDSTKSISSSAFKSGAQRILGGSGKVYNYSQLK